MLLSFAKFENAAMYCSAIRSETASSPPFALIDAATVAIPFAVAFAFNKIASASPFALLICSARTASEDRIVARFLPSAMLISLCCSPSESRIYKLS